MPWRSRSVDLEREQSLKHLVLGFSCGPCLHSAITNQALTPQILEQIPTVIGKDLEGTCPVCRHVLRGGWGRGLRGAILRMGHSEGPA